MSDDRDPNKVSWVREAERDSKISEIQVEITEMKAALEGLQAKATSLVPLLAAVHAELDRLETGAKKERARNDPDPKFTFEDGILAAVAAIRGKLDGGAKS